MKKFLVVVLIMGAGSVASGMLELRGPDSWIPQRPFQVVVSGLASDVTGSGISGGVYATPGGSSPLPIKVEVLAAAGNLGTVSRYDDGYWNGYDFTVGELLPAPGSDDEVKDGDWIVLTYLIDECPPVTLGLYDYAESYDNPIQTLTVFLVPEPTALGFLSLGTMMLVRRRSRRV